MRLDVLTKRIGRSVSESVPGTASRQRRRKARRGLRMESLEARQMMSVVPPVEAPDGWLDGGETPVLEAPIAPELGYEILNPTLLPIFEPQPIQLLPDLARSAAEADYLIVTADQFADEVLPLALWKHRMGYQTYVATMTGVGDRNSDGITDHEDVYDYIQTAYDADDVKPSYVLLVGDHENVPSYEIIGHPDAEAYGPNHWQHVWHTDYEYACLSGNDHLADLAIGRLPGDTEAQIITMVDKILAYERNPDQGDWYDDALIAGYFQDDDNDSREDGWFMETIHRASDFLGGDFDFWDGTDPYDQGYTIHTNRVWQNGTAGALRYRGSSYPGRVQGPNPVPATWINHADEGIAATINDGVGLVLHRDHGSAWGWWRPSFNTNQVNNLTNGARLPVVFSIDCETGRFDDVDAFCEAWLRNDAGGAVAHVSAQRVSYSGLNDLLVTGIFDSMWDDYAGWNSSHYDNSWHLGEVMNYAKDRVFAGYGYSNTYAVLTARLFNLMGDPSMMLRTETPGELSVTHATRIGLDQENRFTVTVKRGSTPLEGARVCLARPYSSDYWSGETDANGQVTLSVHPQHAADYRLVVTERNGVPYETTVACVAGVAISHVHGPASEGGEPGDFVITRSGPTDAPMTVHYTLSGTARANTDYVLAGPNVTWNSVTIPAGARSANVTVIARQDGLPERTETVRLTLLADPAFAVCYPSTASLSILDMTGTLPRDASTLASSSVEAERDEGLLEPSVAPTIEAVDKFMSIDAVCDLEPTGRDVFDRDDLLLTPARQPAASFHRLGSRPGHEGPVSPLLSHQVQRLKQISLLAAGACKPVWVPVLTRSDRVIDAAWAWDPSWLEEIALLRGARTMKTPRAPQPADLLLTRAPC